MATQQECDQYATELNRKFEELTKWAIANWPRTEFPLLQSDFNQSRREIASIIGPKLGDGEENDNKRGKRSPPFIDTNPMPWP